MNRNLPAAEGATPAMAQWFAAKAAHPDALVFFRLGDFFEMFFDDAILAGEVLGLATSHRGEHNGQPIPMAGVPAHAHEAYLARLLRRGYRVALCDQMETPEQAKARKASTIRREVVRIVTPGTVTEDSLLEGGRPSWLLALAEGGGERLGAAWLDISTGMVCTESVLRRTDSVQTMPVEMSSQAAPRRSPPPSARASSQEGRPPSSRESSVTVPGVTMRTTSRRMVLALRALACSGVSIWSQSATR